MTSTRIHIASALLFIVALQANQSICQPSSFGVKAGLTRSWEIQRYPTMDYTLETRSGFDIGAFAVWFDHPWIQLNSELHFIRKVTGYPPMPITTVDQPDGTGEFVKSTFNLDFVSLSVMPRLRLPLGPIECYGLAGPRVDFSIHRSASVDAPSAIQQFVSPGFTEYVKHFKDIEVGGDFALGIQFSGLLLSGVGLEARYSPDFTTCYDVYGTTLTNYSWEFLLTVAF
jgi:hypothetical protein